ncbi:MAG: arginase family protein [Thermoleophilaceae bacterium]
MPASLIGLHCRTSDRTPDAERGVSELEVLVGKRLGRAPRAIGERATPREGTWEEDLHDSRGCLLEAGGQIEDALGGGNVPVLLAGDCSIGLTTLPTVHRLRPDAKILWLDAHADFNTPESTTSGYLGGMGLAGACGRWDAGLVSDAVDPGHVVLAGVRELDPAERQALERSSVTVIGASPIETLVAVTNALDGAAVYVHLDLDVIDPEEMPAQFPAQNGLRAEKLFDVLEAVSGSSELVGLEVTAFEAPDDEDERQDAAATVLHVIEPLMAVVPEGVGVGD